MSIKELALVKLVGDVVKKSKKKIDNILKSKGEHSDQASTAVLKNGKEVDDGIKTVVVEKVEVTNEIVKKKPIQSTKKTTKKKPAKSKKEEKIALYTKDVKKHFGSVDAEFLEIIVKNLGPSIYRKDAQSVSCTDSKELDTVRRNFLIKKLGFDKSDNNMLDTEIKKVCESMKSSKIKYRATFYYILAKNLKKESALN